MANSRIFPATLVQISDMEFKKPVKNLGANAKPQRDRWRNSHDLKQICAVTSNTKFGQKRLIINLSHKICD
jgi:hypothetical protein